MSELAAKLQQEVAFLSVDRYPFSPENRLEMIQTHIISRFKKLGLRIQEEKFSYHGASYSNWLAFQPGTEEGMFIIGAHFDAVEGTPGADDNASGVAMLLEVAEMLSGRSLKKTICFAAFHLEEFGMLGSGAFVSKLKKEKRKISGMISLEMVGYADDRPGSQQLPKAIEKLYSNVGNFIGVVGNGKSKKLAEHFANRMREVPSLPVEKLIVPLNGWLLSATRLSDHSPFWDAGYPALLITDTSFFRNPHYHLASDKPETLDYHFMARVARGVAEAAASWAS